jgi:hypothetical protein
MARISASVLALDSLGAIPAEGEDGVEAAEGE